MTTDSTVQEQAAALVERTTCGQGLPLKVTDPAILEQIARVISIHTA